MVVNAVCFISGISSLVYLNSLPPTDLLLLIALPVMVAVRKTTPLLVLVAGFVVAAVQANGVLAKQVPADYLHREITITGTVTGLPEHNGVRLRFLFRLKSYSKAGAPIEIDGKDALVRLNWYTAAPSLSPGDQLRLVVKLKAPGGFMNPGGFDYEKWLFQQRIIATGYVRNKNLTDVFIKPGQRSVQWFEASRFWLRSRLLQATTGLPNQGLILALAVGDRSHIQPDQWDRYLATGTNHLLAISGLHITLVAGFFGFLARMAWGRLTFLQHTSKNSCALYVATLAAFSYAVMAGFSVPTQRSLIMFCVLAGLVLLKRHQQRQTALATALIAVCLVNPMSVMSAGFWMSFSAVAVLFLVFSFVPQTDWRHRLLYVLRGHLLITIGLYPLTLFVFEKVSVVAPLANFFAVPIVGMVITPLIFVSSMAVLFSTQAASVLLVAADLLLSLIDSMLSGLTQLPLVMLHVGEISIFSMSLVVIAALVSLLPLHNSVRWLAPVLVLAVLFNDSKAPDDGAYQATFLDVGQGTSVVIRTRRHTLVYDTGPQFSSSFNAADAVIIPYLRSQRIDLVDRLIVSHADRDHSGGADELVAGFAVTDSMVSAPIKQLPAAQFCRAGQTWQWDGVSFQILYPSANDRGSENDLSCVLLISTAGGKRTLLPGDIESAGEQRLLQSGVSEVDILMAPHHGSATSSGHEFVAATSPQNVVYTVGYANRYKFPHDVVSERYEALGSGQFSTAADGAITFSVSDTKELSVMRYRYTGSGFWGRHNLRSPDQFPRGLLHFIQSLF